VPEHALQVEHSPATPEVVDGEGMPEGMEHPCRSIEPQTLAEQAYVTRYNMAVKFQTTTVPSTSM
jgi:hypothetical protein